MQEVRLQDGQSSYIELSSATENEWELARGKFCGGLKLCYGSYLCTLLLM